MIKKQGNKYILKSKTTGKTLGTHPSRKSAIAQERKIQIEKRKGANNG